LMTQVREEACFHQRRGIVRGKTVRRGAARKADCLLYYKKREENEQARRETRG
jgi:type I restriction enzyme, R subunit